VTGIVDFGALRVDTPLADIARLLGSLAEDERAMRRAALNAYAAVRPLAASDVPLIDLLDRSGIVLGGLNWLRWLYLEERAMGPREPILARLDQIMQRLAASGSSELAAFSPGTAP
jgi:Ser/Thr protein kinase RdoA (MazF antagonist)